MSNGSVPEKTPINKAVLMDNNKLHMNGKNKRIEILVRKLLNEQISVEEEKELNNWYNENQDDPIDIPAEFAVSESQLRRRILQSIRTETMRKPGVRLWPRIAAASTAWKVAAAVAAITLGVWIYYSSAPRQSRLNVGNPAIATTNDILPGKNTATLTLANGEVINLSDAKTGVVIDASKLSYNDGTTITSSLRGGTTRQSHDEINSVELEKGSVASIPRNDVDVRTLAVTTPRGGTYQVVLPDGTKVWLNADSKISFPSQFIGKERRIFLINGEAYFEVSKNKKQPFIVETSRQKIEVLGTHFNVNAYSDEQAMKTTLLEGSVKVTDGGESEILRPGHQAYSGSDGLRMLDADISQAIAWKEGLFAYDNATLEDVLRQAARWYNAAIFYEDEHLKKRTLSGSVTRYDNISRLLSAISYTAGVKFKIEGRRVTVSK